MAWLRTWFEGRLEALIQHVHTLEDVTGTDYLTQMESILKGILDELHKLKKLAPDLILDSDSYDPHKIAENKVKELLEEGMTLKKSPKFYLIDHRSKFLLKWKHWQAIATEFRLVNTFKQNAQQVAQHYVNWMKRSFTSKLFREKKPSIKTWEQEFGIKLMY